MTFDAPEVAIADAVKSPAKRAGWGPGRPSRKQAQQRDIELLDRALDLFLENGFERTTIDAITASAGVAKRTVYLRYKDKTTLFKAALQRAIEEWIVPVERLKAAESEDLEETLLQIGQILVANIMSPAGLKLLRITNSESGRMPEIGVFTLHQGTERTLGYLAELFRRRLAVADADDAALAFLNLVVGGPANMAAWGAGFDQTTIDQQTRYNVRLFLHGLLPEDAADRPRRGGRAEDNSAERARLLAVKDENSRLKTLLAEAMLEMAALRGPAKKP